MEFGDLQNELLAREDNEKSSRYDADYVASFSEWQNDISAWRAYADGGLGFSIGIDTDWLDSTAMFRKVLYLDRDEQGVMQLLADQVATLTKPHYQAFSEHSVFSDSFGSFEVAQLAFWTAVGYLANFVKPKGYESEREWRLLFRNVRDGAEARESAGRLVKFLRIPLIDEKGNNPIKQMTSGPLQPPEGRSALETKLASLDSFDQKDIKLYTSGLPYRDI